MTTQISIAEAAADRTLLVEGVGTSTATPPPQQPKKPSAKKARKIRAKNARKGTLAADPRIKITDSPSMDCVHLGAKKSPNGNELVDPHDSFSDEEIADMPVVYVAATYGRLHIWRDNTGAWFRRAGRITIRLRKGERVIQVALHDGADEHDLRWFNEAIEELKNGRPNSPQWVRITSDWADDRTFALVFTSRRYGDPYLKGSNAAKVAVCTERLCREQVHEDGDPHTLETLQRSLGKYFTYEIEIKKYSDENDAHWFVNVDGGAELSEATPEMLSTFANDLQWMSIECANANAKEALL
ncbi:hypothetical protein AKG07_08805 [Microbacterium sp. CGR1]|uniref:hypothetical protein n=1 Tax=Microbacterium sp. CGR1 TaxID=1696072 RepID=UPI00069E95E4|nr:hypothetical protein [Microbacterium sp. CGR1]AKV86384.1 hypothetical protein AKG07_08805 [Microbacterium sp. CGR1]